MSTVGRVNLFIFLIFNYLVINGQSITINSTDYKQVIDMIGGDMERSSMSLQSSVQNKEDVINWGFRDINFNYCRVQFDKNQELVEGTKNWSFYDRQVITMKEVKAIKPDIKFYATLRSDYDGYGNNNNMPDWIVNYTTKAVNTDNYAVFLADYLEYMEDQGIGIHTLAIAKEWASFVTANVASQIIIKLNNECNSRGITIPEIIEPGAWSIASAKRYMNDVNSLGTKDLFYAFSSHDYGNTGSGTGTNNWSAAVSLANSLGKKIYDDETNAGAGGPTAGAEPEFTTPLAAYKKKCISYEAGLSGEVFFEIWSRGLNNETRAIYWSWGGTARRLRGYYMMKLFANNALDSNYITSSVTSAPDLYTMTFRKGNKIMFWVINDSSTPYSSLPINLNGATFSSAITNTLWTSSSPLEGTTVDYSASGSSFNSRIQGNSINCFIFEVTNTSSAFIPDPNKTYYIDAPVHNLRLGSDGSSDLAYTTTTSTTGADVEWKFVAKGNGYWHIDRAAGGEKPRLRSDSSLSANMNVTTANGSWTYFGFTEGSLNDTHFITLPHGPTGRVRLQIDSSGNVNMVDNTKDGSWVSFEITEVEDSSSCEWVTIANEREVMNFSGTKTIRYGANDTYVTKVVTGTTTCGNAFFGDPIPGVGKVCQECAGSTVASIKLEAEDYDGMEKIQTEATTDIDGGENVGWINDGDWLRFDNVNLSGITNMDARIACNFTGGTIEVKTGSIDSDTLIGSISITNTGGNQSWVTKNTAISNASGIQDVYLVFKGGSGYLFNVNWIEFNNSSTANKDIFASAEGAKVLIYPNPVLSSTTIANAAGSTINVYDMNGSVVFTTIISSESEEIDLNNLTTGVYYTEVIGETESLIVKIVKK